MRLNKMSEIFHQSMIGGLKQTITSGKSLSTKNRQSANQYEDSIAESRQSMTGGSLEYGFLKHLRGKSAMSISLAVLIAGALYLVNPASSASKYDPAALESQVLNEISARSATSRGFSREISRYMDIPVPVTAIQQTEPIAYEQESPILLPQYSPQYSADDFNSNKQLYQDLVANVTERDLAAMARIAYKEVGPIELKTFGESSVHGVAWVLINRMNEPEFFPDMDTIAKAGLAQNQFQPVYPERGKISPDFSDLLETRLSYEILSKRIRNSETEEYGQIILSEVLKVLAGKIPDPTGGAEFFYNYCMTGVQWHNKTPFQTWGAGRDDVKFLITAIIGDHLFLKLVPKNYVDMGQLVPPLCR